MLARKKWIISWESGFILQLSVKAWKVYGQCSQDKNWTMKGNSWRNGVAAVCLAEKNMQLSVAKNLMLNFKFSSQSSEK